MTTRRKIVATVGAAVVLAAAGFGAYSLEHYLSDAAATCMNQGVTLVTHEGAAGECVGVTDGSYQFVPANAALTGVENAIRVEDQKVRASGSAYVSVAYLMPISQSGGGVEPVKSVAEQLEGAYTAQYYANRHNVEGTAPLIQLLIASSGTQAAEYGTAVQDIENAVSGQRLAAVAGIGVSLDTTIAEVKALTGNGIPVFASTITSDAFDNIQNLVRVSPSNAQEVNAALSFIKPHATTAFLIQDTNPTDSYDTTIVSEFRDGFPDHTHKIVAIESYNTVGEVTANGPAAERTANRIGQMTSDICDADAGVVLFAGRGRDLGTLITDLGSRPCLNEPVTVLTGDDVTDMSITAGVEKGLQSGVALFYAAEANPGEWNQGNGAVFGEGRQGFAQFAGQFGARFPGVSDNDSNAMMGYDAALTGISAIRLAGVQPSPADVADELSALQGSRAVDGASGPINLSADYQGPDAQGSNPVDKVIPILQLRTDGTIGFVKLEQPPFTPLAGLR